MDYELIVTHHDGSKESFALDAENICDIKEALVITDILQKSVAKTGRLIKQLPEGKAGMGRPGECLPDTIERVSKIPIPIFDY